LIISNLLLNQSIIQKIVIIYTMIFQRETTLIAL